MPTISIVDDLSFHLPVQFSSAHHAYMYCIYCILTSDVTSCTFLMNTYIDENFKKNNGEELYYVCRRAGARQFCFDTDIFQIFYDAAATLVCPKF